MYAINTTDDVLYIVDTTDGTASRAHPTNDLSSGNWGALATYETETLLSSHGDTSYTHSGLNRGDTYFYRIYAVNDVGTSLTYANTNVTTIAAVVPAAPTGLVLTEGDTSIVLSWDAPVNDDGDTLTYRIDVSTTGDTFIILETAHGDSTYTHSELNRGDTYFYRVYSVTVGGTSLNYVSGNVITKNIPGAPTNISLELEYRTNDVGIVQMFVLSWSPPIDDGGDTITSYRIDSSMNGIDYIVAYDLITDLSISSSINAGIRRYYRVYSVNSVGTSTSFASINEVSRQDTCGTNKFSSN